MGTLVLIPCFSSGNKQERERWVVALSVGNLQIDHIESEIVSPDDDPPDVTFRDAHFEIKEIQDPDRRRHDEYRDAPERARTRSNPEDRYRVITPKNVSLSEIYRLCAENTFALQSTNSDAVRASMDLLFYVNLMDAFKVDEISHPDTSALGSSGWRSVSFVMGSRSGCFFASDDAPAFIRQALICASQPSR